MEEAPIFSKAAIRRLILPLIIEQFLAVLVGMADTIMVAGVGETAVSPTPATMIVSAIPTKTARNCSMISGRISRLMAAFENIGASSISLSLLYTALRLLMTVSKHSEDSSVCRVILFV